MIRVALRTVLATAPEKSKLLNLWHKNYNNTQTSRQLQWITKRKCVTLNIFK